MVRLEMKVGRRWHNVGEFDDEAEATNCIFDQSSDYKIFDLQTGKSKFIYAQFECWQDSI